MEKENKYGIILDGKMDEAVWETAQEYTGFVRLQDHGGQLAEQQTFFKILPCEDRVYFGFKCMEPDMQQVIDSAPRRSIWETDRVELFISPAGKAMDFYQLVLTFGGVKYTQYYIEEGRTKPGPYIPDWHTATYAGEDYWSAEIELPLTAFYMTPNVSWSDTWTINIARGRTYAGSAHAINSTWCPLKTHFREFGKFRPISGFPMRPENDDRAIEQATVVINEKKEDGYYGEMTVRTSGMEGGKFTFTTDHGDSAVLDLCAGTDQFTVPCHFEQLYRYRVALELKRERDGKIFKIFYPVTVTYEPIKLEFTLPEYRCNFYPGQDYSKIVGKVITTQPVQLNLEGPGIESKTITPGVDGSFQFETPDFEIGEAFLTATIDGYEIKQKIRRLAPSDRMMSWISGGNLVVDGKPVLRRDLYARYYRGGEAFRRRYDADDLHETKLLEQKGWIQPGELVKGAEGAGGEATKDGDLSEAMKKAIEARIAENKDRNFAYYYPSDEPECRGLSPIYMRKFCEYIADIDPYHVMLMASRSPDTLVKCVDWVETHPYINARVREDGTRDYSRPLYTVGDFVDKISMLNRPDKCIGFLPTCFAYPGPSGSDYVTFDEYLLHTWSALLRGAKSVWPYAYHDINDRASLYEGTRYIFSSLEVLEDIILFGKRNTLFKSTTAEAVVFDNGNEKLFAMVNFTQQPQTVKVDGLSGTWHEFRGSRTFTDNTFELKPQETVLATNVVKGADLPTYAETAALIDRLEYERCNRGSLLFNRFMEITATTSGARGFSKCKLFDGVQDNLACWIRENPDNFLELNLTKVKPTFQKIVLHGWKLEDTVLKFRNGDELVDAKVAESSTEEFCKTFILAEPVTPDAIRFEFGGKLIELYELEVF